MKPEELQAALADTQPVGRKELEKRAAEAATLGDAVTDPGLDGEAEGPSEAQTDQVIAEIDQAEEPVTEPAVANVTRIDRRGRRTTTP